ncbi:4-(cytidine 5'-diphospho)-2-C-methyl-D-erythritol kinase [Accumulibacter sp.]|uniref:4-(cytidine 5'-diphospho)-2-C-methyl-D-erythritol kinase n=1 Tax=Accumulibacter sp. TaxID=2053492 RepID=UPI0025F146C6|nr:4-(cytidine 5'-diphospho)-2-C-methyl-D-erythritol kinase [Accumulibacter sp.]MCM8595922.1 4-(cytidine 5'-diphospho)-2-C-methyl-D-erythritol kinase [Accumulibacter sp.]MCM8627116.1 4-(cytidine 5'-diphospho)-2-C-methyl-D-erythritol kinase [Accumulibacter sp.]MDS4050071.1 4-(cytidine 5'-diphospho)-2-C-methyl-D-erythritol kinase [Accumulibacter sp.]
MSDAEWDWDSVYPAPAKLNLFLHVVGRRSDGYHLLQTVFRLIDRADRIRFAPREDGQIRLLTPLAEVPADGDLTVRAARLLQTESGCRRGADIVLDKRLPLGGGLGGGSSDAATVLLALNHLWRLGLARERLQQIGLALGADVPVFVFGRNAFAEGIGEALQAVELPACWYVVLEPPVAVPTAAIFGAPELRRDTPPIAAGSWQPGVGINDLEAVACARFPSIAEHLAWLSRHAPARMSGSGACVFAGFARREEADDVLRHLPAGISGWTAAGLDRHPLHGLAA